MIRLPGLPRSGGGVKSRLLAGASEASVRARRVLEGIGLLNGPGEDGDRDHLGNLVAGVDLLRLLSEICHEDEDFAAIAGVDHAGCSGDAAGGDGGAVADEQAQGVAGVRMARFDRDAGANADGGAGLKGDRIKSEDIVAQVFAGMRDDGQAGGRIEEAYAKHK